MNPVISVILPVYNAGEFLKEAIESLLAQTFADFELIAIDDGSTDTSPALLADFAKKDNRLHIHTQPNHGVAKALNTGLQLAEGKYVARMDADDISHPERFQKQIDFLEAHPETGLLGSAAAMIDANGRIQGTLDYPLTHFALQWSLCFYNPIIHPSIMVLRETLLAAGGYRPDRPQAEDYDLFARLSLVTRLANLPERLLYLRKHGQNITLQNSAVHLETSAAISREMIRSISGQVVPICPLELAWKPRRVTDQDLNSLSRAIDAIYAHFLSKPDITSEEKNYIRRETALLLFRLVRNADSVKTALTMFVKAISTDPLSLPQAMRMALHL